MKNNKTFHKLETNENEKKEKEKKKELGMT